MTYTFICLNKMGRKAMLLWAAASLLTAAAFGAPAISLSPASGPPTSKIKVSGKGFPPGAGIDVFFHRADLALAIANSKGTFSIAVKVPASAQPGKSWVTALVRASQTGGQTPVGRHSGMQKARASVRRTLLRPPLAPAHCARQSIASYSKRFKATTAGSAIHAASEEFKGINSPCLSAPSCAPTAVSRDKIAGVDSEL
jgi:hypothetical protein